MLQVFEEMPLSQAAHVATGGVVGGAAASGRRDSVAGGGVRSHTALCFLREQTLKLERVVRLMDLDVVVPALKPLHALALGDNLGDCAVVLLGDAKVICTFI